MPPDPPPLPIDAQFVVPVNAGFVDFDQLLSPAALDVFNWSARINNMVRRPTVAFIPAAGPFQRVQLQTFTVGIADPGPDVITFSPPPFDVVASASGVAATSFANFPLTVFP